MVLSEADRKSFVRRLLLSRMRLLSTHGFYGLLLMHLRFSLSEEIETAATDGTFLYFSPNFLRQLNEEELDFVLLHEVLHAALQHCARGKGKDNELFNIACDIVVNSTILQEKKMDLHAITLRQYGEAMHLAPNGEEGFRYSAEEVYEMLKNPLAYPPPQKGKAGKGRDRGAKGKASTGSWVGPLGPFRDDHSLWDQEEDSSIGELWLARVLQAAQAVEIRDPSNERGLIPGFARRILGQLRQPQVDWRTVLREFLQPEVMDYSFSPPDRRFSDTGFFLPDYNEMDRGDEVEDILFMVDTSGSVSDPLLDAAVSEIQGAIHQFRGRLKGWIGFFDVEVTPPVPIEEVQDLRLLHPVGGGGTDFSCIFAYIHGQMEKKPAFLVILTDGYAPFPPERAGGDIPVLWLLSNDIIDPPWGKVARIKL